jgi:hypothetical protein
MPSNNETGHLVNTSNMISKIDVAERHTTEYKPSNVDIALTALTPLKETLTALMADVSLAERAFSTAVSERRALYEQMDDKATRSIALLKSSNAVADKVDIGVSLLKKYRSVRISKRDDETTAKAAPTAADDQNGKPKTISNSQQGFVNKLGHFKEIIQFLGTEAAYKPNEVDLKIEALEAFRVTVEAKNSARNKTADELSQARDARDKAMYAEPNGAYYLAKKMMDYVAGSSSKSSVFYKELLKYPVRNKKAK